MTSLGQRGFSLIEVLVTMIILALGLLGFAGLQAHSLKTNRTALQRSQATMVAYDVIDRIRANKINLANYELGTIPNCGTNTAINPTGVTFTAPSSFSSDGSFTQDDLEDWLDNRLANALPGAQVAIDSNGSALCLAIKWTENVNTNSDATFVTTTGL